MSPRSGVCSDRPATHRLLSQSGLTAFRLHSPAQSLRYNVHSWFHDPPIPLAPETHCTLKTDEPRTEKLTILHFNDVRPFAAMSGLLHPLTAPPASVSLTLTVPPLHRSTKSARAR